MLIPSARTVTLFVFSMGSLFFAGLCVVSAASSSTPDDWSRTEAAAAKARNDAAARVSAEADAVAGREQEIWRGLNAAGRSRAESESKIEAEGARLRRESEAKAAAEAAARRRAEAESGAKIEAEGTRLRRESEAKVEAEAVRLRTESEGKVASEAAARRRAEAESEAKVEAEAVRLRRESEAKVEAEAVRLRTESEAKAASEAAARRRAEAESGAKIEAEGTRLRRESEGKVASEAAARRSAEADGKIAAETAATQPASAVKKTDAQLKAERARAEAAEKARLEAEEKAKADEPQAWEEQGTGSWFAKAGSALLWYIPNRLSDLMDVFTVEVGAGEIGVDVQLTRCAAIGAGIGAPYMVGWSINNQHGIYYQEGWYADFLPLRFSDIRRKNVTGAYLPLYRFENTLSSISDPGNPRAEDPWAIGVKAGCYLGLRFQIHATELADFIAGVLFIDFKDDDKEKINWVF